MRLKRTLTLAVAAPALALVLAGCSDGDPGDGGKADEPTSQAPEADDTDDTDSPEAEAPEATEEPEVDTPAEGSEVSAEEFQQLFSRATTALTTARMTMTQQGGPTGAGTMEGVVDYTTQPASMDLKSTGGPVETHSIVVDGIMYMNLGAATDNKFTKTDLSKEMQTTDPLKAMDEFMKNVESVTYVGEEDVEGTEADHYTVQVKVPEMAGIPNSSPAMTLDFWCDDETRPVVMETSMEVNGKETTSKMVYSDFGTDVSIKAPPASQITDKPAF